MDIETQKIYIDLLENVNQQINLLTNPYGVLVMILSFLVAVLAIGGIFIVYRQSKEYKDYYKKIVLEHRISMEKEFSDFLTRIGKNYKDILKKSQAELKRLEEIQDPTKKQMSEIEEIRGSVKNLRNKKIFLILVH